jgi:DNA-binding MltR family transcriptional regulator
MENSSLSFKSPAQEICDPVELDLFRDAVDIYIAQMDEPEEVVEAAIEKLLDEKGSNRPEVAMNVRFVGLMGFLANDEFKHLVCMSENREVCVYSEALLYGCAKAHINDELELIENEVLSLANEYAELNPNHMQSAMEEFRKSGAVLSS